MLPCMSWRHPVVLRSSILTGIFSKFGRGGGWVMMTSSNGNIFCVAGHLCGDFLTTGELPSQMPATRSFDVFFYLRLNKRLSIQSWRRWFETSSCSLCRGCNALITVTISDMASQITGNSTISWTVWKEKNLRVTGHLWGEPEVAGGFPSQRACNAWDVAMSWRHPVVLRSSVLQSVPLWLGYFRSLCADRVGHDDVVKWKHFLRCWPFVRGIHRSPMNSPHKGQWRRALTFSFRLNKRWSKKLLGWWFETPSTPVWRHCNVGVTWDDVHFTWYNCTVLKSNCANMACYICTLVANKCSVYSTKFDRILYICWAKSCWVFDKQIVIIVMIVCN